MSKSKPREMEMGWGMGTGPSVLLAVSQRNMWVRGDHARTSSGPLADPWIGRS